MRTGWQRQFELWTRFFTWAFGLILAGVAVSQVAPTLPEHASIQLYISYFLFLFAALITWYFDIKRLKKDN